MANKILTDKNIDKILKSAMKQAASEHKKLSGGANDIHRTQNRIATIEEQMGNLADAIAASGFTDKLRSKHEELETEHKELADKLAVMTQGKVSIPKLENNLRKGLRAVRENIENLSSAAYSKHATAHQKARLRTAVQDFLGEVPLRPDYEADRLIATIQPTQEALALLATGPGAKLLAYRSGSGGRMAFTANAAQLVSALV